MHNKHYYVHSTMMLYITLIRFMHNNHYFICENQDAAHDNHDFICTKHSVIYNNYDCMHSRVGHAMRVQDGQKRTCAKYMLGEFVNVVVLLMF